MNSVTHYPPPTGTPRDLYVEAQLSRAWESVPHIGPMPTPQPDRRAIFRAVATAIGMTLFGGSILFFYVVMT